MQSKETIDISPFVCVFSDFFRRGKPCGLRETHASGQANPALSACDSTSSSSSSIRKNTNLSQFSMF